MNFKDPIFIGELNPVSMKPEHALYPYPTNVAGWRLCTKVLAIRRADYLQFSRHNLCVGAWKGKSAKLSADHLRRSYGGRKIVLLGAKVSGAFGVKFVPNAVEECWYEDTQKAVTFVVLNHPSGRCLAWNEPGAYEKARALMQREFPHIEFGSTLEKQ